MPSEYGPEADNLLALIQKTSGKLPKIVSNILGSGINGSYAAGSNTVTISPAASNPYNTLLHELTHAVDQTAIDKAFEKDPSSWIGAPKNSELKANVLKLLEPSKLPVAEKLTNSKNPYDNYRIEPQEARAFGYANLKAPAVPTAPVYDHLDSTMATEVEVMMDLLKRNGAK